MIRQFTRSMLAVSGGAEGGEVKEGTLSDDDSDSELPGYQNYLVFCDESGIHGSTHYGFGSLWLPAERRGDLPRLVDDLRREHRLAPDEIKWTKINRGNKSFYMDLARLFFSRRWLMFHGLVVRRGYVNKELHDGNYDLARRKHFTMLIKYKIGFFAKGSASKAYHVRVDPFPSSYAKADEAAHKIANSTLRNEIGHAAIKTMFTRDSRRTLGIQIADLLIGAVMSEFGGAEVGENKKAVRRVIAEHLGWNDLAADTKPREWKFNVWYFQDPTDGTPREVKTRPVKLLVPMPPWRPK